MLSISSLRCSLSPTDFQPLQTPKLPRTHEKQNTVKKVKGVCSFFQKYINWPNITRCLREKYFFSRIWAALPASYAYGLHYWLFLLFLFYSFPSVIAPAFSTTAVYSRIFHSCMLSPAHEIACRYHEMLRNFLYVPWRAPYDSVFGAIMKQGHSFFSRELLCWT